MEMYFVYLLSHCLIHENICVNIMKIYLVLQKNLKALTFVVLILIFIFAVILLVLHKLSLIQAEKMSL